MKRWQLILVAVLALLCLCGMRAQASYPTHFHNGVSYRFHQGYWWHGNHAYTRTHYQTPGYYSYGVWYAPVDTYNYVYSHEYVPTVQATTYKAPEYKFGQWQGPLLDAVKQKDSYEGQIRLQQYDYNQFQSMVKLLGMDGPRQWQGYGSLPLGLTPFGSYYGLGSVNQLSFSTQGVQGDTLYGHVLGAQTYNSNVSPYNDTSAAALIAGALRMGENSQAYADKAVTGIQNLAAQSQAGAERIAAINARRAAAVEILKGLEPPTTNLTQKQYQIRVEQNKDGTFQAVPVQPAQPNLTAPKQMPLVENKAAGIPLLFQERCADCHIGEHKRGGFSLDGWPTWKAAEKVQVLNWLAQKDRPKACAAGEFTEQQWEALRAH